MARFWMYFEGKTNNMNEGLSVGYKRKRGVQSEAKFENLNNGKDGAARN